MRISITELRSNMNSKTLQPYLDRYGPLVADRARQAFEPLHVPATDAAVTLDLKLPAAPGRDVAGGVAVRVTEVGEPSHFRQSIRLADDC
jgi:hypothetical protein